jgi:hypothetical protein
MLGSRPPVRTGKRPCKIEIETTSKKPNQQLINHGLSGVR